MLALLPATSGLADLEKVELDQTLSPQQSVWRQHALKHGFQISVSHSQISVFAIARKMISVVF